jgi:lysophospholipase L1-like esterase
MPGLPLIICFGDSLTAGFQSSTATSAPAETPYGAFLQEMLKGRAVVQTSGVCGERTCDMVMRFPEAVVNRAPTFTVILGGTNDLGWNIYPGEILGNLRQMYELASLAGIRAVAITVPSIRGFDQYIAGRHVLNTLIREYCEASRLPCVDLFRATAEAGSDRLADEYSNDGLHLTTAGYRLIARLLYDHVFHTL